MDQKLAMKLYNVMCATEKLEKDLTVGKVTSTSSYKAVGEKTVLNMIKPLFKNEKLILIPKDGDISENVFSYVDGYDKNKLRAITQLKVFFTIIDAETGESVNIVGFGNGADSQDKGSGKAFTYALKTALSKTFMLFSGEDTDNTHSDDIEKTDKKDDKEEIIELPENPEKVSTKQLLDMATKKGYHADYLIAKYKKETNKVVDDIKFISGDIKKTYYNQLSGLKDKV